MSKKPAKGHVGGRGIVLDITQEIINVAIPRDSGHCIVADAMSAAVPDAKRVSVDLQTIAFSDFDSHRRYVYFTPAKLQQLLLNFDQGIDPEPFTIRLGKPCQVRRSGTSTQRRREAERKRGQLRREADPVRDSKRLTPLPEGDSPTVAKDGGGAPTVLGGRTPPVGALSNRRGRRRTFGLKSARP